MTTFRVVAYLEQRMRGARFRDVVRVLEHFGFTLDHVRGSHHYYGKPGVARMVPVPKHSGELSRSMIHAIIIESGISRDDFLKQLRPLTLHSIEPPSPCRR